MIYNENLSGLGSLKVKFFHRSESISVIDGKLKNHGRIQRILKIIYVNYEEKRSSIWLKCSNLANNSDIHKYFTG